MNASPLLPLPILLLGALLWLGGLGLARWRVVRRRWPSVAAEWAALGVLAALALGFFWRVLLTRDTWLPRGGGDFNSFYYPLYRFAADQIAAGHFPLWNPYLWGGMPFAADQQTGLFSPFNLVAFLLARPFAYGTLEWLVIGQVWLASVLAYAFCRELGVRRSAALIGGVTFAYSGFIVSHLGHYPMIAVAPWLPATFLALRRMLLRRSFGWSLATAGALLLALLAGHQQIFLYLLTATAAYWTFLTWTTSPPATWPTNFQSLPRWLGGRFVGHWFGAGWRFGLALAVTVGLAAPALLPSLELARLSIRAGISYTESTAFALRPLHLVTLLIPNAFGSTPSTFIGAVGFSGEVWGYVGVVALGLAAFAFIRAVGSVRREALFFAGLALLALVVALGPATPLQGWFYAFVPGYSRVRASGRWLFIVDFALATLAALGTENLLNLLAAEFAATQALLRQVVRGLLGVLGVGVVVLALGYSSLLTPRDPSAPLAQLLDSAIWTLVLVALALALLYLLLRGHLSGRVAALAVTGLVVLDLFAVTAPVPPTTDDPLSGYRHDDALATLSGAGADLARSDYTRLGNGWQPSWGATVGRESVAGTYDPLGLATYNRYWAATDRRHDSPRYDLLNIRYLLLPPNEGPSVDGKFREIGRGSDYVLYENTTVLPRAFLVGSTKIVTPTEAWAAITATDFNPRAVAYLGPPQDGAAVIPTLGGGAPRGTVTIARPDTDQLTATVESDQAAVLVFSEVAYPGWRATIDGQPTPLLTADYTFRAVAVPAGHHDVRLVFDPPLWHRGWLLASLTAAAVILGGIAQWVVTRRRRATVG